jgi:cytochrome P450
MVCICSENEMEMESSLALFLSQKAAFGVVMIILSFILWQYLVFLGKMRGPLLSQLLETLVNFFVNMNDIYDWITQLIQRYGGSVKLKSHWMGFSFVTTDPKHIEYIVKTKFSSFPKGRYFKSIFLELMGDGILTADGEEWVSVRKMMSSVFHSPAFKRKLIDTMDVLANSRLVAVLEHASRSASALDIQDVIVRLAFDGICTVVFGVDVGCLSPGLEDIEVERAFHEATEATAYRFITPHPVWKTMRFWASEWKESSRRLYEPLTNLLSK